MGRSIVLISPVTNSLAVMFTKQLRDF